MVFYIKKFTDWTNCVSNIFLVFCFFVFVSGDPRSTNRRTSSAPSWTSTCQTNRRESIPCSNNCDWLWETVRARVIGWDGLWGYCQTSCNWLRLAKRNCKISCDWWLKSNKLSQKNSPCLNNYDWLRETLKPLVIGWEEASIRASICQGKTKESISCLNDCDWLR